MITKSTLEAAVDYIGRGWPVLPVHSITESGFCTCGNPRCSNAGKHPWCNHGVKDASTDEQLIKKIFTKMPNANVGIAAGKESGLLIIDIDCKPDEGIDGGETLRKLEEQHGALPETVTVLTPSGGRHLYFRHPGLEIKNAVKFLPGLDVRTDNGFVVAPPSRHASGREYVPEVDHAPDDLPLAKIPEWLLKLLPTHSGGNGKHAVVLTLPGKITAGHRNDVLFKLGCAMRARGMSQPAIEAALREENAAKCMPLLDPAEVKKAAESSCRYEPGNTSGENLTDSGNANRLVARHGHDLRYCKPWKKWFYWTGACWTEDRTNEVTRRASETVRNIYAEASAEKDDDWRRALGKWAARSEAADKIRAMIELANSKLPILPEDFDKDPWLLNCLDGTLNLKTRQFQDHNRADLITKISNASFSQKAECPQWIEFQNKFMAGNEELIKFKQKMWGSCLTGMTKDKALFVLHGEGGDNGKSTEVTVVSDILNTYAMATPIETFLDKGNNDKIPNDLARLKGARLVYSIEVKKGRRLDEALVKQITGRDKVAARFMRAEWFEFIPEFKPVLAVNHLMRVSTDAALHRRIRVVPYEVKIPKEEQIGDFDQLLLKERDGILAWLVDGCYAWQEDGLGNPPDVENAGKEYQDSMDPLADFINEKCFICKEMPYSTKTQIKVKAEILWSAYGKWTGLDKTRAGLSRKDFKKELESRGFLNGRLTAGNERGTIFWFGIGLVSEENHDQ